MAKFANTKGLSKQEKFMIRGMLAEQNTTEEIAKYLDREVGLVEGFVQDITPEEEPTVEAQEETAQQPVKHIINETANGNKGVAIYTSVASEKSDATRPKRIINKADVSNQKYTHKIK